MSSSTLPTRPTCRTLLNPLPPPGRPGAAPAPGAALPVPRIEPDSGPRRLPRPAAGDGAVW